MAIKVRYRALIHEQDARRGHRRPARRNGSS